MIEVFKIIKGIYDPTCVPHLDLVKFSDDVLRTSTRGKVKFSHTCYRAFGPELIEVYRQSARR